MGLGSRLAKLEAARDREGASALGVLYEGTEEVPDAVRVGDARLSVAEFARRYPRGTLVLLADYALSHYAPREDRSPPPPAEGSR